MARLSCYGYYMSPDAIQVHHRYDSLQLCSQDESAVGPIQPGWISCEADSAGILLTDVRELKNDGHLVFLKEN